MGAGTICSTAIRELADAVSNIDEAGSNRLVELLHNSSTIFVAGAGRSRLILSCFAMRLMHLGFRSYVAGDTVTPAAVAGDLVLAGSGAGETATVLTLARKAQKREAHLVVITATPDSTLARLGELVIRIAGKSIQPGGNLFEQAMLVYLDCIAIRLAEVCGIDMTQFPLHANLE